MIQKTKKTLSKGHKGVIVTASVLVFLIVFYIVMTAIINSVDPDTSNGGTTRPDIIEGESYYGNYAIAYPHFSEDQIQSIAVRYRDDEDKIRNFSIVRPEKDESFVFYYSDENGDVVSYRPPICTAEGDFDYTDLYAIETSDGLNLFKLSYLCAALGVLYFDERIELSSDPTERAGQLNRYGLNDADREGISVKYLDNNGEEQTRTIFIGDKLITGVGHYFMIDGRNYVYNSLSNSFDYALNGFIPFLHSRLVAEGLDTDKTFEPYLTTDYKQWKNIVYKDDGTVVKDGSKVIITADLLTPLYNLSSVDSGGLYKHTGYKQISMDLKSLKNSKMFESLVKTLKGNTIGDKSADEKVATVVYNSNAAELGATYKYSISEIAAVFTDTADVSTVGTPVGSYRYIKVRYSYTVTKGDETASYEAYGLIDLLDESLPIPDDAMAALHAASVGELDKAISFELTYDESNTPSSEVEYVIDDITLICKFDEKGDIVYHEKVQSDSIVSYTYYFRMNGEILGAKESAVVDLSKITEENTNDYVIKQMLLGKSAGKCDKVAYTDKMYCQVISDFIAYSIRSIDYFVTQEIIVSFKFVNASERDPFFGESLYINTLTNSNKNYGLNSSSCETVVRYFGGINPDSSSILSAGLVGKETVAVGLTPENMQKYGLYAHTVYFELPRNIIVHSTGDDNTVDDYGYTDTLGFTLYISDEQSDGTRYIGSEMYGIIASIDGRGLEFLEKSFVDFWARRNLASVNYSAINNMTFEFFMDDVYGSYNMEMEHEPVWIINGVAFTEKPEKGGTEYDRVHVHTSITSDTASDSLLKQMLEATGKDSLMISTVYTQAAGADDLVMDQYDTLGTSCYKDILNLLFNTYYNGTLTEAEQRAAYDKNMLLMRISFTIESSGHPYVYEFFRLDDRRIMVSIYREDEKGTRVSEVSAFYLSTFAFKKIVHNYQDLINGIVPDVDAGYQD